MNPFILLGQLDRPLPGFGRVNPALRDALIVTGAILAVVLVLLFWLTMIRTKSRRRRRSGHQPSRRHSRSLTRSAAATVKEIKRVLHLQQRHRRQPPRPPNPTLAERGGLPPVRKDEPPGSPAPRTQT